MYPEDAAFPLYKHLIHWFDHYLKGIDNCAGSAGTGERALRVSVDAALRAGIFKASGSFDPMGFWDVRGR